MRYAGCLIEIRIKCILVLFRQRELQIKVPMRVVLTLHLRNMLSCCECSIRRQYYRTPAQRDSVRLISAAQSTET